MSAMLSRELFGTLATGEAVEAVTLTNDSGMSVRLIGYGASIQSVIVPDAHGHFADVTMGYATLEEYIRTPQYFGATVGRVANRLAYSRFTLDGREYHAPANDGPHSLHGGPEGFDKKNWELLAYDEDALTATFALTSPDGDQGYPGTLRVLATYQLGADNSLSVQYRAATDAATCVNLSNHAYWNLAGEGAEHDALDHILTIAADAYLPVDAGLIPTGERRSVANTAFDFREPTPIRARVRDYADIQMQHGRGYDHNWIISDTPSDAPQFVARLEDPHSGRVMTLLSNQPGVQFYSGNFFDGSSSGKAGKSYRMGDAIALEPQCFPDAPNQPSFHPVVLLPGETYANIVIWRFETAKPD